MNYEEQESPDRHPGGAGCDRRRAAERAARRRGRAEGRAEGREQERLENKNDTVVVLRRMGLSEKMIAEIESELEALRQGRLSK